MNSNDLYAALMHEFKNHLGLLGMTLDRIPLTGETPHDGVVDEARLLCQRVIDRLQQALLLYKAEHQAIVPLLDAYSPADVLQELADTARSLARQRLAVEMRVAAEVPAIWFFDRNLVEMALLNALHNSLGYARSRICLGLAMHDGGLEFYVHDDSDGYPAHVLLAFAEQQPYRAMGTGLGLQFARIVAQAHDHRGRTGTVLLANADGAVFRLRLP